MMEMNYWGGDPGKVSLDEVTESKPVEEVTDRKSPEIESQDLLRAKEAVISGESTLYLVDAPPVDFSMMNIGLDGEIYEISYNNKIYGYSASASIFRTRN